MSSKRLLAAYDLSVQPANVENFSLFQAAALVVLAYYQLEKVDVCFVLNKDKPLSLLASQSLALSHALQLLPIVQFNPKLGSVFIREDDRQLQQLIATGKYVDVWPPLGYQQGFLSPAMELLGVYYQNFKKIPVLRPKQVMQQWARNFYAAHVIPNVPITVNFDCMDDYVQQTEWLNFFNVCLNRYPVKFVLLSTLETINEQFSNLPNVIIAREYYTTLEQEITLVMTAFTHLGPNTGLSAVANLTGKALALFNVVKKDFTAYRGALLDCGNHLRYAFAPPAQRLWIGPIQSALLVAEFERIWQLADPQQWLNQTQAQGESVSDIAMWLR